MASENRQLPNIFLLNSTEGTLVAKSISWNIRKVSIGCDQPAHLWQLNKEYTTQTVFYLRISFRHLFIILIHILNHYNLIQFIRASCLRMMFYAKWLFTSYHCNICLLGEKLYYAYLSNVACRLDAHSLSYIVGNISPTILIW